MAGFIRKHQIFILLLLVTVFRLVPVFFSHGFIHSDDHFDSIEVAYDWLRDGPTGENGYLRWKDWPSDEIGRFPLYTLFLYSVMKAYEAFGVTSLNTMMYGIRFLHALLAMIPVFGAFGIVRLVTGKTVWAVVAGAIVTVDFAMPFLSVRNLIEVVGGNLWAGALYCFYRYRYRYGQSAWMIAAGIMTGLAWMIRFQIAFAVLPIPFILWYEYKSIRPALQYSLAVAVMLVLSGLFDLFVLGSFASSTIRNLTMNTSLGALYRTIPLMYPALLLGFLVPPFAFVAVYLLGRPDFIKKHPLLFISSASFLIFHISHANQQERFIFPIIPAILILTVLALWEKYNRDGYILRNRKAFRIIAGVSVVINAVLVVPLMFSSGHQGQVEPMVWIGDMHPRPSLFIVQPEIPQWPPLDYAGLQPLDRAHIRGWDEMEIHRTEPWNSKSWDVILVYPKLKEDLPAYVDSVQSLFGEIELVRQFRPSFYDNLLHSLNKKHNPSFACWAYRPVQN